MADKEQRNGRMLFTDFDASDKGRPVAVFGGGAAQAVLDLPPPPPVNAPVPTLDDIAASLGFAFEDDSGDAPPSLLRPAVNHPAAEAAGTPPPGRTKPPDEDDHELVLDETEHLGNRTAVYAAPPVADAPTWDALTSAYARARPAGTDVLPDVRSAAAFAPPEHGSEPEQDDAVDVLSMLDEYLERENRSGAPVADASATQSEEDTPFPEARHIPYGGIERVDDWFAPPEKQPETLQRVEDWFSPPEEQPPPVLRVDDWYESPEADAENGDDHEEQSDLGETKVDISWLSDFQNELPAGEYWHKKTTRIVKRDSPGAAQDTAVNPEPDAVSGTVAAAVAPAEKGSGARPAAADTAALFSGMDFDSIWEHKVAETRQPDTAPAVAGDTRRISLFDDIDIDALWDKKQEAADGGAPQAEPPPSASAVRAKEDSGADATIIVPQDALDALDAPAKEVFAKSVPPAPAPSASAPQAQRQQQTPQEPASREQRAEAVAERSGSAEPDAPAAPDGDEAFDDVDAFVEEAAGMDFDGAVIDGDRPGRDAAEGGEREYVARTPPAEHPGKKNLTADDLLDGIDIDSLAGETGDVSAPVIDDSAIDDIPKASRTGTAEMCAVAEGETGEEPASVAVNPMDVFADMDNMDFSDDVDDDMRAMLDEEEAEGAAADAQAGTAAAKKTTDVIPASRLGRAWRSVSKAARRYLPMRLVDKALGMVAWRENWWFYCDLVAAVVASASLAVIISYFFWYRGV